MSRITLLFIGCLLIFSQVAIAEEAASNHAAQLAGWWEEFSPSSNIVYFGKDGSLKLLLKKGEIGELHSLDGTWALANDSTVHLVFTLNGQTIARDVALSFNDSVMILTDEQGVETKHRRHSGKPPKEYIW